MRKDGRTNEVCGRILHVASNLRLKMHIVLQKQGSRSTADHNVRWLGAHLLQLAPLDKERVGVADGSGAR